MTPESWWRRRSACAKQLLSGCFSNGMGKLENTEPRLASALRYVLERPGSMARAVVAYMVGIEMGLVEESARALSCGIEYLHTASLIFDDLPAMDDAQLRRGDECVHLAYGESTAILAALALVNRGYAMLWQGVALGNSERRREAAGLIDKRLGVTGVIGGQAYDLGAWAEKKDTAGVSKVAAMKTADLLRLTVVLPAILGRASRREIQLLDRLALFRGLAYQAADDLKDVFSSSSGKSGGRDELLGRPNLVACEGIRGAANRLLRLNAIADKIQLSLPQAYGEIRALSMLRTELPAELTQLSDIATAV
jgi:geranylgeranyl pyrophosphate synthase